MRRPNTDATSLDRALAQDPSHDEGTVMAEARERMDRSIAQELENVDEAIEDQKFLHSDQWSEDAKQMRGTDRPMLTINLLPAYQQRIVGAARQNRIGIRVRPAEASRASDVERAKFQDTDGNSLDPHEVMEGLVAAIERQSSADEIYIAGYENSVASGWGYWRVLNEYVSDDTFDQRVRIAPVIDPLSVQDDPDCEQPDRLDRVYAFVSRWVALEELQRLYPDKHISDFEGPDTSRAHWFRDREARRTEYMRRVPVRRTIARLSNGELIEVPPNSRTEERARLEERMARENLEIEQVRQTVGWKVEWMLLTGNGILEGPITIPSQYIPLVFLPGRAQMVEGKMRLKSLTRDARDPQRGYNYSVTAAVENHALQGSRKWVAAAGQVEGRLHEWQRANANDENAVLIYDEVAGIDAPRREDVAQLSPALVQLQAQMRGDIPATIGLFNPNLGVSDHDLSGKALRTLQAQGDLGTAVFPDHLAMAVRATGRIVVDMIPRIYTRRRVVRILRADGDEAFVELFREERDDDGENRLVNNLSEVRMDVHIEAGPSLSTQREQVVEWLLRLIEADPASAPVVRDVLVRNLDFPGSKDVADRLFKMVPKEVLTTDDEEGEGPSPAEQLQMQLAQAQLQLAEREQEAQLAKADAEIAKAAAAKFKALVDAVRTAMESNQQLADPTGELAQLLDAIVQAEALFDAGAGPSGPESGVVPGGDIGVGGLAPGGGAPPAAGAV